MSIDPDEPWRYRVYTAYGFVTLVCLDCNGGRAMLEGEVHSWEDSVDLSPLLDEVMAHERDFHRSG